MRPSQLLLGCPCGGIRNTQKEKQVSFSHFLRAYDECFVVGLGFGSVYGMCGGGKSGREGKKEEEEKENVGMSRDAEIHSDVAGLLGWLSGGTVGALSIFWL